MASIIVRQRNQVTIPKSIAEEAGLAEGMVCDMQYANGVITIRLAQHRQPGASILRFAGVGTGLWGADADEIDGTIAADRASWHREFNE